MLKNVFILRNVGLFKKKKAQLQYYSGQPNCVVGCKLGTGWKLIIKLGRDNSFPTWRELATCFEKEKCLGKETGYLSW